MEIVLVFIDRDQANELLQVQSKFSFPSNKSVEFIFAIQTLLDFTSVIYLYSIPNVLYLSRTNSSFQQTFLRLYNAKC